MVRVRSEENVGIQAELLLSGIMDAVLDLVSSAESSVVLIAPYMKTSIINEVLGHIPDRVEVKVITRWKIDELGGGFSDLGVYDVVKRYGGLLYLNQGLHAKMVIVDDKVVGMGSANFTRKGLGRCSSSNFECFSSGLKLGGESRNALRQFMVNCVRVDDDLYDSYVSQVEYVEPYELILFNSSDIVSRIEEFDSVYGKKLLNKYCSWLIRALSKGQLRFGKLSSLLHDSFEEKVFRKDVKRSLSLALIKIQSESLAHLSAQDYGKSTVYSLVA